ncbi:hypothetical protein HMI55_002536 [Coelomomyces lativittatus]|nr:hypothetical protein HMI55_002536 [Coelomomyces lativittatus]
MTGELIPSMDSSTTTAGSSSMNSKKKNRRSRSFRSLALSNTTTSSSDLGDLEPKNIQMTFKSKKKSNNELSTSQSADRNQFHSTLRSFSQSSVPSLHQNSKSIPLSEKYLIPSYVTSSKKTSSKTPLPFSSAEHSKKQMPSNHSQAARSQSASSPIFQPPPSRNSCFKTSYDKKPRSSSDIKQVSSSEYSPPKKNVTYSSMASTSSKSKRTSTPVPYDLSKPVPSKTSFEPSKTFFSNFNENSTHFSEHHPPHIQKNIPPPMHPLQKKYQEFRPTRVPPSFTSFSSSTNTFSFTSTPASFNNLSSSTSFNVQAANFIPFKPPPNHSNLSITSPRSNVHGHSKAPKSEPQWIPPSTSTTFVPNHVQTIVSMDYRSIEHMNFQQFQKMLPPRPGTNREVLHNIDDVTSQFSSQLSLKEKTYPTRSESHRSLYVPKNLKSTIATRTSSSASSSETSSFSSKSSPLIYTNYLSKREMEEGLVSGKFMYGILRARKASPVHAYVKPIVPVLPLIYTQQAAETYYETNQRLEMATSCNLDPLKNGKKMDEESNVDTVTQIQTELDDVLSQTQESNQEVLIFGHFNRNRAMEGDFVI